MSDADVRTAPARGRSSARGGRGGFGRGGPRGGRKVNGTSTDAASLEESLDDQGELGEMKKKHAAALASLKEIFHDWTDTDLVFVLEDAGGDVTSAVEKITQGAVSQFAEVKKPKDRARSKAKEPTAAGANDKPAFGARGGRGRGGFEGTRGGRGRGTERGRGGHRGGRGGHASTNGIIKEEATSVPTTESTAWDTSATTEAASAGWDDTPPEPAKNPADAAQSAWANGVTAESTPAAASEGAKSSLIPEGGAKKTWASMLAKPKPAPVPVPQPVLTKQPPPAELAANEPIAPPPAEFAVEEPTEPEHAPPAPVAQEPMVEPAPETAPVERPLTSDGEELTLTPSKDPLTEENVEHLPDESHPPATHTVASTAGSLDPRNLTPLPSQQAPIGRPPMGGYATAANRLAGTGGRTASFQRRVLEQQEAVVMPGHNALDRAAVQFGSMGLNGDAGLDVDDDREEPETRLPPQHSPPSQPRTSLPPIPRQVAASQEPVAPDSHATPKQAPGLPPASAQNQQQIQDPSLGQNLPQEAQMNQQYNQYGRYGQPGMQQESVPQQQKPYDPFSHQAQQSQFDQFGHSQQLQQQQQQQHHQSGFGGLSSAPSDYSSYYTSDQPRNAYNQYYGSSALGGPQEPRSQAAQSQTHDPTVDPQRSASGFGAGPNESAFAAQQQQAQSRFAEAPGSGNNTPNPLMAAQQQQPVPTTQAQQHSMHAPQGHQQGHFNAAGFPYGHPYYNSPYQTAYANQFTGYSGNQPSYGGGGYGGGAYQGKQGGGMYGGPQGAYGVGSQSSYDQHSSSPANANAFAQNQQSSMRSTSGMGSGLGGLDEYGRASAQPGSQQQPQQQQSSAFGGMSDPFARSASGFGAQGSYGQQGMGGGADDSLKAFDSSKNGPSPSSGQPGRPGSAANNGAANSQSGLPAPQTQHSGFGGGYSQYGGGFGGLGSHGQSQGGMGSQYAGAYGGFNQTYGSYGQQSRGGWGANYGHGGH